MFGAALLLGGQCDRTDPATAGAAACRRDARAMPFFIPYGPSITADRAAKIVAVVLAEASKHPTWRFAISVVGPSGDLVYFYKMDDTQLASITISQGKARTAARFRRESRAFYNAYETGHGLRADARSRSGRITRRLPAVEKRQIDRRPGLQRRHRRSRRHGLRSRRRQLQQ